MNNDEKTNIDQLMRKAWNERREKMLMPSIVIAACLAVIVIVLLGLTKAGIIRIPVTFPETSFAIEDTMVNAD